MLFCGRKLTAQEACSRGLVSQVFWPTTFSQEVMLRVKEMASCSAVVRNQTPLWLNYISQRQGLLPRLITWWVLSFHNHTRERRLPTKSGEGSVSSWSFSFFRGREGYFLSPSLHLFNMSGTSLPQILKGDFNIGFLHEGGRVCNYTTVGEISVGPVRKYICLSRCPGLLCFSWVCLLFCTCTVPDSAKCSTQCTRRVR